MLNCAVPGGFGSYKILYISRERKRSLTPVCRPFNSVLETVMLLQWSTALVWWPISILLPQTPNFGSHVGIMLLRASDGCIEPLNKFLMHNALHIALRFAVTKPRQDRSGLRFVFIGIFVKVDSSRIVAKQERCDSIEQAAIFSSQSAAFLQNLFSCA